MGSVADNAGRPVDEDDAFTHCVYFEPDTECFLLKEETMRKSAVTFTKDTGIRINMPDGSARHYEVCECDTCSADDMRTCNGDVADNPSPITRNFLGFVRNFLGFVRN